MKIFKVLLLLVTIALIISLIYKFLIYDKKQRIEVHKLVLNENIYEEYKNVTKQNDVNEVRRIIKDTTWESSTSKPSRPADYIFVFQYVNPKLEAKAISYQLWIEDKNRVEIYRDTDEHTLLSKEDSTIILDIFLD